jgi:hypothetical protein
VGRTINGLVSAFAFAAAAHTSPAAAQYMPHLDPNLYILATMNFGAGANPCMIGKAMAEPKIAEARNPSLETMQAYFRAAQDGTPKSEAFHLDKHASWKSGSIAAGQLEIDQQADPLAVPDNTLDAEPLRFYRGGSGATALGQWAVLDAQGQVAGVYTGFFTRSKKVWKLRELTVSAADEAVAPATQYCVKPGDVMEHRLTSTKNWRENAEKSVNEARTKLAAANEKVSETEAASLAGSRDTRLVMAARDAKRDQGYWTKQLEKREKNLADALEKSAEAEQDAAEIKRLTGEARHALAFRVADAGDPQAQ